MGSRRPCSIWPECGLCRSTAWEGGSPHYLFVPVFPNAPRPCSEGSLSSDLPGSSKDGNFQRRVGLETPGQGPKVALGGKTCLWEEAGPDPCKIGGKSETSSYLCGICSWGLGKEFRCI